MAASNGLDAPPSADEIAQSLDAPPTDEEMRAASSDWKGPELKAMDKVLSSASDIAGTVGKYSQSIIQNPIKASAIEYRKKHDIGDAAREGWKAFGNVEYKVPPTSEMAAELGVPNDREKAFDTGLVLNPWASKGRTMKITPADVVGAAADTVMDPVNIIGGAVGLKTAKAGVEGMAGAASRFAEERAYKAATGQNIGAYRRAAKVSSRGGRDAEEAVGRIRGVGRRLLDSNSVGYFSNTEGIGSRMPAALKQAGREIEAVGGYVDAAYPSGSINGKQIASDLVDYAESLPPTPGNKILQNRLLDEAQVYDSEGQITFKRAQKFKDSYKYKPTDPGAFESSQDTINEVKAIIGKHMDEAAAKTPYSKAYQEAKKDYGAFAGAAEAATDRALKNQTNRWFSPSDVGLGGVGVVATAAKGAAGISTAVAGMAVAVAHKQIRTRGAAFAARSLDAIAKGLRTFNKIPAPIARTLEAAVVAGPTSVIVTHNLLMNSDPEYRAHFEEPTQ